MKKQRRNKPNDPDYIDIFAEDEDSGNSVPVSSLFDEDEESVSAASEKKKKASGGFFSRKKKPEKESRSLNEEDDEEPEEEETDPRDKKKKRSLFSHREKDEPEDTADAFEEEDEENDDTPPSRNNKKRRGLFSHDDEDEEPEDELDEDGSEEEDDDSSENGSRSSLFVWREHDEDEEPPRSVPTESSDEEEPADEESKKRIFSFRPSGKDKKDEAEKGASTVPPAPADSSSRTYTSPGINKDEDWDIGGDFSDSFTEPEQGSDEEGESTDGSSSAPETDPSIEERAQSFSFDRYGRRKDKSGRSRYGSRKNARKATTSVVTNETDTSREEEEARIRAKKRDQIRDREISKRKAERRVRIIREIKQRLTVAGLLGILLLLVLLAAFFAFRITGIDVSGVCTRYSAEEIVEISGLKRGKHILMQDLSAARDKLNNDPYLSASVKYVFPNKINITVSQRRGIGAVQWGPDSEYLALIDQKGFVLETNLASQGGLPMVKGLVVTRVVAGKKIGDDADEQVQSTLDVLNALDEFGILNSIKTIDMSETMGISLFTPEGYRIELGNVSDLATKFGRLKKGWKTIMSTAADQMKKPSVDNVTIYLYAKSGVVVSPHGIGFIDESQVADTQIVMATPEPGGVFVQEPGIIFATPEPTPEPVDIIPPFNNEPFTG